MRIARRLVCSATLAAALLLGAGALDTAAADTLPGNGVVPTVPCDPAPTSVLPPAAGDLLGHAGVCTNDSPWV